MNIVSYEELIEKIEDFNKKLFMIKDKKSWIINEEHEILETISKENESVFTIVTEINPKDFCYLIQNKKSELLLNNKDYFGVTPFEKTNNDLHVLMIDVGEQHVLKSIIKAISNFNHDNKKTATESLLYKMISALWRNKDEIENFMDAVKEIKNYHLNKLEINYERLITSLYHSNFYSLSDEKLITELKNLYPSKEMNREIFIYTQNLKIVNEIKKEIDSKEMVKYIREKVNSVELIMDENIKDEKNKILSVISVNLEKEDIINNISSIHDVSDNMKKKRI